MFLEDKSLPEPDAVLGFEDDGDEPGTAPTLKELLENDDVKVVLAAAEGLKPAALTSPA